MNCKNLQPAGPAMWSFGAFVFRLNKLLTKPSNCQCAMAQVWRLRSVGQNDFLLNRQSEMLTLVQIKFLMHVTTKHRSDILKKSFNFFITAFRYFISCYLSSRLFSKEIFHLRYVWSYLLIHVLLISSGIFSAVTQSSVNITSTMEIVIMIMLISVIFLMDLIHCKSCNSMELSIWTNVSYLQHYKEAPMVAGEYLSSCASWCMATDHCVMFTWSPGTCQQVAPFSIGKPVLGRVYVPRMARSITGEVDIA